MNKKKRYVDRIYGREIYLVYFHRSSCFYTSETGCMTPNQKTFSHEEDVFFFEYKVIKRMMRKRT